MLLLPNKTYMQKLNKFNVFEIQKGWTEDVEFD